MVSQMEFTENVWHMVYIGTHFAVDGMPEENRFF